MNDEVPAANGSVRGDTANSLEDLITQVDVKFIAQEHRLFYILRNAWEYSSKSKADPRRRAAFDAFVFRFGMAFVQRSVVASAGIAGFAGLLLAWQANRLVSEQNDLLRLQYVGERQVVYRADIANKGSGIESIKLCPISSEAALLGGAIYFPSTFYGTPLPINQDGRVHHLGSLEMKLREYVQANYKPIKDHAAILVLQIPVLVISSYVAKNETYDDVSLYAVELQVIYSEESFTYPSISVDGFSFLQRLPAAPERPRELIDEAYSQFLKPVRNE
jgi:hypothetical protein